MGLHIQLLCQFEVRCLLCELWKVWKLYVNSVYLFRSLCSLLRKLLKGRTSSWWPFAKHSESNLKRIIRPIYILFGNEGKKIKFIIRDKLCTKKLVLWLFANVLSHIYNIIMTMIQKFRMCKIIIGLL